MKSLMPDYNMYQNPHHKEGLSNYSFLITRGSGFIGSNLSEYLLKYKGRKVRILDNLSTGSIQNIQNFLPHQSFEFIEGDIRNFETCKSPLKEIDFVSHQAALGSIPRSILDPITTNEVNIPGFVNILVAVKESGVNRMVYATSSST